MIFKFRLIKLIIYIYFIVQSSVLAEIVKKIEIQGNERISSETIKMFANLEVNQNIDDNKLNEIIKSL